MSVSENLKYITKRIITFNKTKEMKFINSPYGSKRLMNFQLRITEIDAINVIINRKDFLVFGGRDSQGLEVSNHLKKAKSKMKSRIKLERGAPA